MSNHKKKKKDMKTNNEMVIVLHGIGLNQYFMISTESKLQKAGYEVLNLGYPFRKLDLDELGLWLHEELQQYEIWQTAKKVHFVGHSMGGLITRTYLTTYKDEIPAEKMGRVVMLGTPNGGSEVADFLHENPLYQWVFGPAGQELTTKAQNKDSTSLPWYDLGIIAGTQNWLHPFNFCINEPNDGCVSVSSTRLKGMKDHIILPVMHGLMSWTGSVNDQALHFLQKGSFAHQ